MNRASIFNKFPLALLISFMAIYSLHSQGYTFGEDSKKQDNVPVGTVIKYTFNTSKVYPGTTRDYWVYVPKQDTPDKPACLMIFNDGNAYVRAKGGARATLVFDNLIHNKEMPVTIGVFINPGTVLGSKNSKDNRRNRSVEYDTMGDVYSKFLIDEIIPAATKGLNITKDKAGRAICGISSGGIGAWTAAWERPDYFSKVLSHIGSFTNIRGGNIYPALIRKTEPKPIRVFLQEGENDLNNLHGNWPLANRQMASALEWAGYDMKFVMGTGKHSMNHGGAILPASLRWLWRGYPGVKEYAKEEIK